MTDVANMITNVGFPIAVSVYLLVRMETRFKAVVDSNNRLADAINGLIQVVGYCNQTPHPQRPYKLVRRVSL